MKILNIKKEPGIKRTYLFGFPILKRINHGNFFTYSSFGINVYQRNHINQKEIKKTKEENKNNENIKTNSAAKATQLAPVINNECLNVAFKLTGGLGDLLVAANYLYVLFAKLNSKQVKFHIYAHRDIKIARAVFKGMNFVSSLHTLDQISDDCREYPLFVEIQRYPFIRYQERNKIFKFSPILIEMIFLWERFRVENTRFWLRSPWFDGQNQIEIVKGRKRIQQPDVYGKLGVDEEYKAPILIEQSEISKLKEFKLKGLKYITIHRGVDAKIDKDSTKLWPFKYYNLLIKYIKEKYHEIIIVQLGINTDRCPEFKGVDLYLAGQTSLDDVKVLLKNSFIHIDGEGGFVHLRNALHGGPSIVFFGPTSEKFYGYKNNINLRGNGCSSIHGCEWVRSDWQKKCVGNYSKNECMYSITPEIAFENFCELMERQNG